MFDIVYFITKSIHLEVHKTRNSSIGDRLADITKHQEHMTKSARTVQEVENTCTKVVDRWTFISAIKVSYHSIKHDCWRIAGYFYTVKFV